jgi:hypothetical protein
MQDSLRGAFARRYALIAELALLVGMAVTLAVPSSFDNIKPWYEFSIALYIRAAFWITGLAVLPGLYLFRIGGFLQSQNQIVKFTLSSMLSFAVVGVLSMIYYSVAADLSLFPILLMVIIASLALLSWRLKGLPIPFVPKRLTRGQILLLGGVLATIAIAMIVQSNWRYLIYTDFWTSLFSGIKMLYGRDVYSAFADIQYPVSYGYIIAGFSAAAGTPIVNTQALMLPLIALNPLVFYALVRVVFALSERVAALGAIIYVLSGGLGWVYNTFVAHGAIQFIPLSWILQDMYFFPPFWDQIAFQFKLLALLLALSSLILFYLSGRSNAKDGWKWMIMVIFSALLFVWGFLIHMLPGFLAPLFIAIALFNDERRLYLKRLAVLVVSGVALFLVLDLLAGGIFVSLTFGKIAPFLSGLSTTRLIFYGAISIGILALLVVGYYGYLYLQSRHRSRPEALQEEGQEGVPSTRPLSQRPIFKAIVVACLAFGYLAGLLFVQVTTFSIDFNAPPFPWYSFATRYGFVGILALIGLATSSWRSNWMKITIFWSMLTIILGSIWWGERTNAFLYPMVCLLASMGTISVLKRAYPSIIGLRSHIDARNLKWLGAAAAVLTLLVLSFGSLMVGVYWHVTLLEQTDDNMAATFNWVGGNAPENDTVIIDTIIHPFLFGILHLTDHLITDSGDSAGGSAFAQMSLLQAENARWVLVNDSLPSPSGGTYLVRGLQYYGDLEFRAGPFSVRSVPQFHLPSTTGDVAIVDKGSLGLTQFKNNFVWADDRMDGWVIQNGQASADGEVLTLNWNFTANQTGPLAYVNLPQVSASAYPFLIIHYRNTPQTTDNANMSVIQIVRVGSTSGGNFISASLPISDNYDNAFFRLPSNIAVDRVALQLITSGGTNGTVGLEIDFVGFSSAAPSYSSTNPYFLSVAVPSIWPVNYTVYSDYNLSGSESTLVTTYRTGINEYVAPLQNIRTVILFNSVLFQPSWGEGWVPLASGVISGTYQGKQYIIVAANAQQLVGKLTTFASWLYDKTN